MTSLPVALIPDQDGIFLVTKKQRIPLAEADIDALQACLTAEATARKERYGRWVDALDSLRQTLLKLDDHVFQSWLRETQYDDMVTLMRPWNQHPQFTAKVECNLSQRAWEMAAEEIQDWGEQPLETVRVAFAATNGDKALAAIGYRPNLKDRLRQSWSTPPQWPEGPLHELGRVRLVRVNESSCRLTVGEETVDLSPLDTGLLVSQLAVRDRLGTEGFDIAILRHFFSRFAKLAAPLHRAFLKHSAPEDARAVLCLADSRELESAWLPLVSPQARRYLEQALVTRSAPEIYLETVRLWVAQLLSAAFGGQVDVPD